MPDQYQEYKERSEMMLYQDLELGRERMVQMRTEVEHNRLVSRLSRSAGLEGSHPRKSLAARSAALVMALFR